MRVTVNPKNRHQRAAFTLIELLAVIVVIAILIGLLVPAVMGAFTKVRIASVRTEISQLEGAIGKFKSVYSMDPPSSITLYEAAAGWAGDANSRALVRQLWPQFNFAAARDINGDGDMTDTIILTHCECLVFFLGGMCTSNASTGAPAINAISCRGFSKDPADPFSRAGASREVTLFDFVPAKFTDVDNDGFPEYKDPLPSQTLPYLYVSSYGGQGYSTSEFGGSGLTEPYRQGTANTQQAWKANTYQIISPGFDRNYGFGGAYVSTGSNRLPIDTSMYPNTYTSTAPTAAQRAFEADNITNFSEGVLQP